MCFKMGESPLCQLSSGIKDHMYPTFFNAVHSTPLWYSDEHYMAVLYCTVHTLYCSDTVLLCTVHNCNVLI